MLVTAFAAPSAFIPHRCTVLNHASCHTVYEIEFQKVMSCLNMHPADATTPPAWQQHMPSTGPSNSPLRYRAHIQYTN
jgi:hypothetical protein